jgi:hypothetical protein
MRSDLTRPTARMVIPVRACAHTRARDGYMHPSCRTCQARSGMLRRQSLVGQFDWGSGVKIPTPRGASTGRPSRAHFRKNPRTFFPARGGGVGQQHGEGNEWV